MTLPYRTRQFWNALRATPTLQDLEYLRTILTPPILKLFQEMHPGEQAHSLKVLHCLEKSGNPPRDLLVAALLHDVGKNLYPLRIWERVQVVLTKRFIPTRFKVWGEGNPVGWKRPLVVACQHPAWGARMAEQTGASPLTIWLILHHQDELSTSDNSLPTRLHFQLKKCDDQE